METEPAAGLAKAVGPRSLALALARGPVVADGGLSTALEQLGAPPSGPLWTAEVLATQPAVVQQAHEAYLMAGARVVLSAGYQASEQGGVASGRDRQFGNALVARAVRVARQARDSWSGGPAGHTGSGDVWVAASIGPYGAVLADGSEYRGNDACGAQLRRFHRQRLGVMCEAHTGPATRADVWWCETIPDGLEVAVLAEELSVAMERLADAGAMRPELIVTMTAGPQGRCVTGEPLAEAIGPALEVPEVVAVGVNCAPPGDIASGLVELAASTRLPLVAKSNLGGRWDADRGAFVGASSRAAASAGADFVRAGARLVGGCCGTGPAALAELARSVLAANR